MPRRQWNPRRPGAASPRPDADARGRFRPKPRQGTRKPGDDRVVLYGWHPVKAALENPQRRIRSLLLTENAARRLTDEGLSLPAGAELVRPDVIAARLPADAVHQGLWAEADPLPAVDLDDLPADGIVLVLDQITDPHNVGAILRSAAAFGVSAVITTLRHSPEATGVLAKSASGALEFVPMIAVPNLARALEALKGRGFLLVGLDGGSPADLATVALRLPLGLVLGAEGKGMRQLTRATCHLTARLVLPGRLKTLNVSNATALALHVATSRLGSPRASAG